MRLFTKQVYHHCRLLQIGAPQGEAKDGAQMLFVL
jgi:hypothetical protein